MTVSMSLKEVQALRQIIENWLKVMHRLEVEGRLARFESDDVRDVENILKKVLKKLVDQTDPYTQMFPDVPN